MPAFCSVWFAVAAFVLAVVMLVYRPAMTDTTIPLVLWFAAPGAMCLAGMVLWSYRKDLDPEPGVIAQRQQARVALFLAIAAAAIVYYLIISSTKLNEN